MWEPLLLLLLLLQLRAATVTASSNSNDGHLLTSKTCPRSCANTRGPAEWSVFHDVESLSVCPEPILLKYSLYTPFDDPETHIAIYACTLGDALTEINFLADVGYVNPNAKDETNFGQEIHSRRSLNDTSSQGNITCGGNGLPRESNVSARLISLASNDVRQSIPTGNSSPQSAVALAIEKLQLHMSQDQTCDKKIIFVYVRGTVVGLYSGALVDKRKTAAPLLQRLASEMNGQSLARKAIEICGKDYSTSTTIGVVADTSGDFGAVQKIMKAWNEGGCAPGSSEVTDIEAGVWAYDMAVPDFQPRFSLLKRADCRTIRVEHNEDCPKLARRCGITGAAFENFNKGTPNLCSTLQPGQPVCCSSGTLPDIRPKPQPDGTCATHDVQADEGCQVIAAKFGLKLTDLDGFNKKTWGWDGCGNLLLGQRICVSRGNPPMPAPIADAICGPTVPGSKRPTGDNEDLADLNPCPLNVCCNVWGKCGTTSDFCTISNTTTGNPGTSKPGENGCQSNCGTEIVNNDTPPAQYRKIAYFEGWNYDRPCLNMDVLNVDRSYSHVHFAFAEISRDHNVVIPENQRGQWEAFVSAGNFPKKVLAFGGWAFSNEDPDAVVLREIVSPANRENFAERVVRFAVDNQLSGLDFDWEYPGATDIDGAPVGEKEDGENYFQFLKLVREKLPDDKSLSIAAPASYWYLRGFPVKKMAEVLDYIVYMTYDFHGQWDVGNKWAQPGCPTGTCLRSHINSTTTHDSLVMVTKAGVPSHKVVVGVSSYGRSFTMADPGCRGPMCTYLGARNESPAAKGRCTGTGGYISDFEINEIIARGDDIQSWYDRGTDSDYLVYDQVEWVAYMSNVTKSRRTKEYKDLNFGGTSDWAVDLQGEGSDGPSGRPVYLDPEVYQNGEGAHCRPPCILVFPPSPLPSPTVINPGTLVSSLEYGAMGTTTVDGEETTAFITRTTTITVTIPPITVSSMSYSNINITSGQQSTELSVGPSIELDPIPIPVPNGEGGTTTRTLILPPWPSVTKGPGEGTTNPGTGPAPTWPPHTPQEPSTGPPPGSPTNGIPTYTTYPPYRVTPVPEHIEDIEEDDDGGFLTPCDLWFFNLCPGRSDDKIGGLRWILPPGIYPPGPPPPRIIGPPGIGPIIKGPPPPWPPITVGSDGKPTFTEKPNCETDSASICSTTVTISTITAGPTTTTVTSTVSGCDTVYGCSLTDWETATTTRTEVCELPTPRARTIKKERRREESGTPRQQKRQDNCGGDIVVIPRDMKNVGQILEVFEENGIEDGQYFESYSEQLDLHVMYIIPGGDEDLFFDLDISPAVYGVFYNTLDPNSPSDRRSSRSGVSSPRPRQELNNALPEPQNTESPANNTSENTLRKRVSGQSNVWAPSQVSLARKDIWLDPSGRSYDAENPRNPYVFFYDEAAGEGQYVYIVGESEMWDDHSDFVVAKSEGRIEKISPFLGYLEPGDSDEDAFEHGTMVAAMVMGETLGVCAQCNLILVRHAFSQQTFSLQLIDDLVATLDHILANGRKGKAVVNMSWSVFKDNNAADGVPFRLAELLEKLESEAGAVLVAAAGNVEGDSSNQIDSWPALFGTGPPQNPYETVPRSLIVVGGSHPDGYISDDSRRGDWIATFAPSEWLDGPNGLESMRRDYIGTSYAAPMVAGLAAYFRSLDSQWKTQLENPAAVKKMVRVMHRRFDYIDQDQNLQRGEVPVIWNAQVGENSCLSNYDTRSEWDDENHCPELKDNLDEVEEGPIDAPGDGGEGGQSIDWSEGEDAPKCKARAGTCGGELCRGYYCSPNPVGVPPDFRDPKDPNGPNGPGAEPGDPDDDPDDEEPPEEEEPVPDGPSPYNWAVRYYGEDCGEWIKGDEPGNDEMGCAAVDITIHQRYGASGFTKGGLKACFYDNMDCATESSSNYASFSGGDRIWPNSECVGFNGLIQAFRITEGSCVEDEGYWAINWYDDNCEDRISRSVGTGSQKCSTDVPDSAKAATGYTLGGDELVVCLYENSDCDGSGTGLVVIGGGSPLEEGECLEGLRSNWQSYKVASQDQRC